jgi:excisionase family DNA binding protein
MALIAVSAASAVLGISAQRTYELVRTGVMPPGVAVRLGRQVRIDEEALRAWIHAGGQALPGGWRRSADDAPEARTVGAGMPTRNGVRCCDAEKRND